MDNQIDNFNNPPIELETYDYDPEKPFFANRAFRITTFTIRGRRQSDSPFLLLHEDNCISCGQQFIYKSLGIWEEVNRKFQEIADEGSSRSS